MNENFQQQYYQQPYYPQQVVTTPPMYGGQQFYSGYNPTMPGNPLVPQYINALTDDEIKSLRQEKPNVLNINFSQPELLRSMCTHKNNGMDVVQGTNDDEVWCPICNAKWKPEMMSQEELKELIDKLLGQMQNAKWLGDLPVQFTRELFTIMPILERYPAIHEYAMNNFNRYFSSRPFTSAPEMSALNNYNSLFGVNYGYPQPYQQPYPQQQYYQQYPQMQPYPQQQPMNPYANPMDINGGGYNPMMQQQQMPPQPQTQIPYTPAAAQQQMPVAQPQQPQVTQPVFATPGQQAIETKKETITV